MYAPQRDCDGIWYMISSKPMDHGIIIIIIIVSTCECYTDTWYIINVIIIIVPIVAKDVKSEDMGHVVSV